MSIYNIEVVKIIQIMNPKARPPLMSGDLTVNSIYAEKALKTSGMVLHSLEPFEIIDKIGFLKTGDEAAEMLLDALAEQLKQDVAAGGSFLNMSVPVKSTDDDE